MANFTTLADLYAGADGDTATVGGSRFIKHGNQIDRASSLSHPSGTLIPLGKQTFQDEVLWTHSNPLGIAIPATPTSANMTAVGFAAVGASTADKNQRIFTIVRTTNALTEPTAAEIKADNGGVAYAPIALDKAKVTNQKRDVVWFTHDGASWGAGISEAQIIVPRNFNIQRTDNSAALATDLEAVGAVDGDFAEIVTLNGSYYKDERAAGVWVRRLSQPIAVASDTEFMQTWDTMTSPTVIGEKFTATVPGGTDRLVYEVEAVLTKGATWDATEAARYKSLGINLAAAVVMTGATATTIGSEGLVPAPAIGEQALFLRGDGDWAAPVIPALLGATATVDGAAGIAPRAVAGQENRVLHGDATWRELLRDDAVTDLITLSGVAANAEHLGTFAGTTISDNATVKTAIQALETALEAQKVTGRYIGSANTYAALPVTSAATGAAINGDWAALAADDIGSGTAIVPQYPKGVYITNGTVYSFAFALGDDVLSLTNLQVADRASVDFGLVSGERINQAMTARDARINPHFSTGDTIDFDTAHNLTGDIVRLFSFDALANLTKSPDGSSATGVTGHAYYSGDENEGQQYVYFLRDTIGRETEFWRGRSAGAWLAWASVSSDSWEETQDDWQISSGMHVIIADNHKLSLLATDRVRAIRMIPKTGWDKVGAITVKPAWSIDGSFPTKGKQEVVVLPDPVSDVWRVSTVDLTAGSNKITTVQAGLGTPVSIEDFAESRNVHINSVAGVVTYNVAAVDDGTWHYVMNVGTVAANVTVSGAAGVFYRNGTANDTIIGGVIPVAAGQTILIHVTNNAGSRFVNVARLGGGSAAGVPCPVWTPNDSITLGMMRQRVMPDSTVVELLRTNPAPRTSEAAWNVVEAGQWSLVGQSIVNPFVANTAVPFGYRIRESGAIWQHMSARQTFAAWNSIERNFWQQEYDRESVREQALNATAEIGYLNIYPNGATPAQIKSPTEIDGREYSTGTMSADGTQIENYNRYIGRAGVWVKQAGGNSTATSTFNGLQRVSSVSTILALTATSTDYDVGTTLLDGDLLEVAHTFNNNATESQVFFIRVASSSTQRTFPWPDAVNHQTIFDFPATLTSKVKVKQTSTSAAPRIIGVKVWRDAANGFVIPAGTQVVTNRNITGSLTATGYDNLELPYLIPLAPGTALDTVSPASARILSAAAGLIAVKPSGADVVVAHTTKVVVSDLTNFTDPGGNTLIQIMVPYRGNSVLDQIEFTFKDRRAGFTTRTKAIVIPMSYFQDFTNNGWIYARVGNYDSLYQDVTMPDNSVYQLTIYFQIRPNGLRFNISDTHASITNSYGTITDFVGKFRA